MADSLISPSRLTGTALAQALDDHWPTMRQTRRRAAHSNLVIAGEDDFVLPDSLVLAGAEQYIASIPHPTTVPDRVCQELISDRPRLSIPLGPKGLGITAQRLTTKVEEPLNAILEDERAGFRWEEACSHLLYAGWCASVTVLDPADWQKHNSQWDDSEAEGLKAQAGASNDPEEQSRLYDEAGKATDRAKRRHGLALDVHRARNVPIRNRIVGIANAAPIFGRDLSVEGLLVSQEYSLSYLRRHYEFGDAGVATPTGGNGRDANGLPTSTTGRTLTLIEGWLYDEEGIPYYTCCVKGAQAVETRYKGRGDEYDGQLTVVNLKEQFNLDRLPVAWAWGLGNRAETKPDRRARGFTQPFEGGWRSVRAKLTANNVSIALFGYPILLTEGTMPALSVEDDEPEVPDLQPFKITDLPAGRTLKQLQIQTMDAAAFKQIELELGLNADEAPGKANADQSGFSQSMAAAFEQRALSTVRTSLGKLYAAHGSFVLEAGRRLPEMGAKKGGAPYAPIMVFASTDVPTRDNPDRHHEPMELDPDLIDETFHCVPLYPKSMSVPEEQQSMEAVARNLKTRRQHLEDTGDTHPEETELELLLESIRTEPAWRQYALKLMAQVQGSEELKAITQGQQDGLMDKTGTPTAQEHGVAPAPQGAIQPLQQGAPGVPQDGSVTGGAPVNYGQSALAGAVGGASMAAPISRATAAGGVVPPNLPRPGGV